VQGDEAVLLGQYAQEAFLSMRFVKEDGRWKIKDFVSSNKAYPADSVYAMIPPGAGAFERAGAPWQNVAPAFDEADAAKQGWQVRAVYDESFLYIRIESSTPIPAPGSQAEKPPGGWPAMKVGVSGVGEFVLHANANIGDQATFDKSGRANGVGIDLKVIRRRSPSLLSTGCIPRPSRSKPHPSVFHFGTGAQGVASAAH